MSYILDALRRADSERERGGVPSLHAKPIPDALAEDDEDDTPRRTQPLLWAVIVLLVLLLAVLAWQLVGSRAPEPVLPSAPPALAVTPPVAAPPPPPVAALPTPPAPVAPAPEVVEPPRSSSPPARPAQRVPQPPPQRVVTKKAPPAASAPSAEPEAPVMAFNQLPDNIRRELPQLVIGGAMYSKTPTSRMLILNGQVFHEGDKVAGELVLEQIRLKSAVLAYKGYRYGINY